MVKGAYVALVTQNCNNLSAEHQNDENEPLVNRLNRDLHQQVPGYTLQCLSFYCTHMFLGCTLSQGVAATGPSFFSINLSRQHSLSL